MKKDESHVFNSYFLFFLVFRKPIRSIWKLGLKEGTFMKVVSLLISDYNHFPLLCPRTECHIIPEMKPES